MASITIRNLDEQLKAQLRMQAASHGHSMERRGAYHSAWCPESGATGRPGKPYTEAVWRSEGRRTGIAEPVRQTARPRTRHMILLDTNVLSELMRPAPDLRVVEWLDR